MKSPSAGVATLLGGVLIHLTLGTVYCWGNSTVYITSYLRIHQNAELTTNDTLAVYASALCGQGFFMFLGGVLENRFGARLTCFLAVVLVSLSTFCSSFCKTVNSLMIIQFIFGIGIGLAYVAPMKCGYRHFPTSPGLVSGIIVAGFGAGSFIFNFIISDYVNKHDKNCDDGEYYSADSGVPQHVPGMYRILGVLFFVLGSVGVYLLKEDIQKRDEEISTPNDIDTPNPSTRPLLDVVTNYTSLNSNYATQTSLTTTQTSLTSTLTSLPPHHHLAPNHDPREIDISSAFFLGFSFICCGTGGLYLAGSYKSFGEEAKVSSSDAFFTSTGSINSLFNTLGRIVWGMIADRLGVFQSLVIMSGLFPAAMAVYSSCGEGSAATYRLSVWVLFFFYGGNFSLFPTAMRTLYGAKHMGQNYGSMFLLFGVLGALCIYVMGVSSLEYSSCNWGVVGVSALGFVFNLSICFKEVGNGGGALLGGANASLGGGGGLGRIEERARSRSDAMSGSRYQPSRRIRTSTAARRSMESLRNLTGRYALKTNVNYEAFLAQLGVNWALRKAVNNTRLTIGIEHLVGGGEEGGGVFLIKNEGFLTSKTSYSIGGDGVETWVGKVSFIDFVDEEAEGADGAVDGDESASGRVIVTRKVCERMGLRVKVERFFMDERGEILVVRQSVYEGLGGERGRGGGVPKCVAQQYFEKI